MGETKFQPPLPAKKCISPLLACCLWVFSPHKGPLVPTAHGEELSDRLYSTEIQHVGWPLQWEYVGNLHLNLWGVTSAVLWELRLAEISWGVLSTRWGFLQSWQWLAWSLGQEFVEGEVLGARPALALLFVLNEHSEPLFLAGTIRFYGNMSN